MALLYDAASHLTGWVTATSLVFFAYFLLLMLYRLTLHPLARAGIPGPKWAAATYWYSFYQDLMVSPGPGHEVFHFADLHDRYGPVVRVSPDEVHIRDPEWFDTLYASGRRDKWLRNHKANGSPGSITQAGSSELHRMRRSSLHPFFSRRAVTQLESIIGAQVKLWTTRLEAEYLGRDIELSVGLTALTLDVITEYCFGQSWRCLSAPGFDPGWKTTMNKMFQPVALVKQFPWLLRLMNSFPRWVTAILAPDMTRMVDARQSVLVQVKRVIAEHEEGKLPLGSGEEEKPERTVFETILRTNMPSEEKTPLRLTDEGFVLVAAGAETTARTLTNAIFYLLEDRKWLDRVRAEIDQAMPHADELASWSKLESLPCLAATVKETLRLCNPVTNRLQLIDANELTCNGISIPGGTPLSMTVMDIHLSEDVFTKPLEFNPGRWFGESGKELGRFYIPFLKGTRSCLGQNLAYAEIYLALASILRKFEMRLPADASRSQVETTRDCFVGMPDVGTKPLRIELVKRRA